MIGTRTIALALATGLGALTFAGTAQAACTVATGTISVTNCDTNERIDAFATGTGPAKLVVSGEGLATTGSDDNGYLTFKATTGPLDIERNCSPRVIA